jgi:chorismate synthase
MFSFFSAGESHGQGVVALISGVPSGFRIPLDAINAELKRRQKGYGRGGRMAIETDRARVLSGIRGGMTIGSPIALLIENRDSENWKSYMNPEGEIAPGREVTRPRPGHADLAGAMKYDHGDLRNVLERASARETAARVAAGALAKLLLSAFNIRFFGYVVSIGGLSVNAGGLSLEERAKNSADSPFSTPEPSKDAELRQRVDRAKEAGDTLGGVIEVVVVGVPPGLGSYEQWNSRVDGMLAGAVMSVPAIKGVEIGDGFALAETQGSAAHDEIFHDQGRGFYRRTNRAGGIEGGVTNGEPLVIRAAMKPIPTLMRPLASVDISNGKAVSAAAERSDVCAVPAAAIVVEAMVALVIAGEFFKKFGGDSRRDITAAYEAYSERIRNWR